MMHDYLVITIGAVLVNNFVLSKFLGICPFLGVSRKLETALGMSGAVIFVMTLASLATSLVDIFLFRKTFNFMGTEVSLQFLNTMVFILLIATLVQLVEIMLQKLAPPLYEALGLYLPLITANCAVLGVATLNSQAAIGSLQGTWYGSTIYGFFSAIGFSLALVLFASLRERLDLARVPRPFQGMSIALITAGILAMAFIGFSGLV
jgi:electron transport complex protein RnfA